MSTETFWEYVKKLNPKLPKIPEVSPVKYLGKGIGAILGTCLLIALAIIFSSFLHNRHFLFMLSGTPLFILYALYQEKKERWGEIDKDSWRYGIHMIANIAIPTSTAVFLLCLLAFHLSWLKSMGIGIGVGTGLGIFLDIADTFGSHMSTFKY